MTQLEQQMIDELGVAQGFTNDLADNLTTKGVPSNTSEGLDTLVPKVLQIESGVAKSPYDEWQEGFGVNWDNVVTNASMTYPYRILHVYVATNRLYLNSFTSQPRKGIAIYNANTNTYRYANVQVDATSGYNYITFQPSDYFTNSQDNLNYVCVVYASHEWGNFYFRGQLPVVYANNKFSDSYPYVSLLGDGVAPAATNYPLLRGIDLNWLSWSDIYIYNSIEHISYQSTEINGSLITYTIQLIQGSDTQLNLFMTIYNDLIAKGNTVNPIDFSKINLNLCDTNLADDFYNKMLYNMSGVNYYNFPVGQQVNFVEKFKIKQTPLKSPNAYVSYMSIPSCVHIDGLIEESTDTHAAQGFHGFNSTSYTNLMDFPMWKVFDGATTGCLRPITSVNARGNFIFVSGLLDPKKFCEFDINDNIIEDPTKYFICNLPVAGVFTPTTNNQKITFYGSGAANFKNWFTTTQRDKILTYVNAKNWILTW